MQSLLVNEQAAREFIETTFPKLEKDQVLVMMLTARHKYEKTIAQESVVFRDIINKNDTDAIIRKIQRASIIDNLYIDKRSNKPIPMSAFVIYVNLLPKSVLRGYITFTKETNDLLQGIVEGNKPIERLVRIKDDLFSAIHRSNSYVPYILIDIDKKDPDLLADIIRRIHYDCIWINETRGGYHIISQKSKNLGRLIYENKIYEMKELGIEIQKETMTPITGTLQGGVEVKRIKIIKENDIYSLIQNKRD